MGRLQWLDRLTARVGEEVRELRTRLTGVETIVDATVAESENGDDGYFGTAEGLKGSGSPGLRRGASCRPKTTRGGRWKRRLRT